MERVWGPGNAVTDETESVLRGSAPLNPNPPRSVGLCVLLSPRPQRVSKRHCQAGTVRKRRLTAGPQALLTERVQFRPGREGPKDQPPGN